jgi:adenosylcobyric acid synthase
VEGYEIHMGRTVRRPGTNPLLLLDNSIEDGCFANNNYGTYLHGFFDSAECRASLFASLAAKKGMDASELTAFDYAAYKERQYNALADALRQNLDMELIYRILEEGL